MTDLRIKLKQYLISILLLTALSTCAVSGVPSAPLAECESKQCSRFTSWGFTMDIASRADVIHQLMITTKIETEAHTALSFIDAINSNWGPHITGSEYSEYNSEILAAATKLGMYTPHNELSKYSPAGLKLYVIILGSHPSQLCSILSELIQMRHRISHTFLIGSTVPVYESSDYLNCSALNAPQRKALADLAERSKFSSDKDIMTTYFNEPELDPIFIGDSQQEEVEASFRSNRILLNFLKSNTTIKQTYSSVIIAAPQPYMPETIHILKNQMRNAVIYRLSSISNFSIYESLNALRSWLLTDRYSK